MISRAERFLIRHYLRLSRRGLVAFMSAFALVGFAVGVAALILVNGVMTGFQGELKARILGTSPHLTVDRFFHEPFRVDDTLRSLMQQAPGVVAWGPYLTTRGLLSSSQGTEGVVLKGVDPGQMIHKETYKTYLTIGALQLGERDIILGSVLASNLGVVAGDTVLFYTMERPIKTPLGRIFRRVPLVVRGIFDVGLYDLNATFALVSLPTLQHMLGMGNRVSGLEAVVVHPLDVQKTARWLDERLPYPYRVATWQEWNQSLFSALKLEKLGLAVVLSLITLVASFTMLSTLMLLVMQRTREIAVLITLGMTRREILRVFFLVGMSLALAGVLIGSLLGTGLAWLQNTYQLLRPPPDVYFIDRLPVRLVPTDLFWIWLISGVIAALASLYPAHRASRLIPVRALREE